MFLEKLDITITILAALVMAIVSVLSGSNLSELALRLVITIVVFFIFGFFIKMYLQNSVFKKNDNDKSIGYNENSDESAENTNAEEDKDYITDK